MPVGTLEHSPLSILQVLSRMGGSMVANTQSGRNRYQQIAAYPPLRITMSSSDKEVLADNSLSCHGSWLNIKMWAIYDWPKCTIERKGGRVRYLIPLMSQVMKLRGALKKNFFWGKFSQMWEPIHPRVFVGFGKTKGEIRVKKRDFRGNLGGWLRGLDLVWESATFGKTLKKNFFFLDLPLLTCSCENNGVQALEQMGRWRLVGWDGASGHQRACHFIFAWKYSHSKLPCKIFADPFYFS